MQMMGIENDLIYISTEKKNERASFRKDFV